MSTAQSGKFVLIDQSIRGAGGHYLEYALRCTDAAKRAGFFPILGVGKSFSDKEIDAELSIIPSFTYTFWENSQPTTRRFRPLKALRETRLAFGLWKRSVLQGVYFTLLFSKLGLNYRRSREVSNLRDPLIGLYSSEYNHIRTTFSEVFLVRASISASYKAKSELHKVSDRLSKIFKAFYKFWLTRNLLKLISAIFKLIFAIIGTFIFLLLTPIVILVLFGVFLTPKAPSKKDLFKSEVKEFLKRARVSPGDIVFIPTLGEAELLGITQLCEDVPAFKELSWRFVFRRNLFYGRKASYGKQRDQLQIRKARVLFNHVREKFSGSDVQFFTDTELLTEQYNMLGAGKFYTTNVPAPDMPLDHSKKNNGHQVIFSYLGDARDEKNYGLIPKAINLIYSDPKTTGKFKFILQSNFNVKGGEPKSALGKLELGGFPPGICELMEGPFSSEKYASILTGSDVVLIPYDPSEYAARSSGVLSEAFFVAKPVVTTGGSWMASIIEPLRQAYLDGLFVNIERNISKLTHGDKYKKSKVLNTYYNVCSATLNEHSNYLTVFASLSSFNVGDWMGGAFTFYNAAGTPVHAVTEAFLILKDQIKILLRVPAGCTSYRMALSANDGAHNFKVSSIRVYELSLVREVACSFAGALVSPSEASLAYGLKDIIINIDQYKEQATLISEMWRSYHSPDNLIQQLWNYEKANPYPKDRMLKAAYLHGLNFDFFSR